MGTAWIRSICGYNGFARGAPVAGRVSYHLCVSLCVSSFVWFCGLGLAVESTQATQFVKLARDVQIVGTTDVSEADVHVAYTAEVKRPHRVGVRRMTYNDFLTALLKLSAKVQGGLRLGSQAPAHPKPPVPPGLPDRSRC